ISAMPNLFEQVARIAKRGRKRWLSLVFVTQLPQHLPRQVLGLVNNYILHKISDAVTISRLKGSIAGIDDGLWQRLPGLAHGQAVYPFASMPRPLLCQCVPHAVKFRWMAWGWLGLFLRRGRDRRRRTSTYSVRIRSPNAAPR